MILAYVINRRLPAFGGEESDADAGSIAGDLIDAGIAVVCQPKLTFSNKDLTVGFGILSRCDVVVIPNKWSQSLSACAEREEALRLGIPVCYADSDYIVWSDEKFTEPDSILSEVPNGNQNDN